MFAIVGLGNPGKKYEGTRHNVGFDIIDHLSYKYSIKMDRVKHKAILGEGYIGGQKVLLIKPQTYMNLSGESVMQIVNFYKLQPEELIVIYDDIDTEVGKIRIRKKGSAGTHNGMKNIIFLLKTDGFPRIRIGVGKPTKGDLRDYVLGRFSKEELKSMIEVIPAAGEAVSTIIEDNVDTAMNQFNGSSYPLK